MKRITQTMSAFAGIDESPGNRGGGTTALSMKNFTITPDYRLRVRDAVVMKMEGMGEEIVKIWCGTVNDCYRILVITTFGYYIYNPLTNSVSLIGARSIGDASLFLFGGLLYIVTGSLYTVFDGNTVSGVTGYDPLVAISVPPSGGGVTYEAVNLLSSGRRKLFSPDGAATRFVLGDENISAVTWVKHNGTTIQPYMYSVNLAAGTVSFQNPIELGVNTFEVNYRVSENNRSVIDKCRFGCTFGGGNETRVFLYGSRDEPDRRYYSELADGNPSAIYFPVNNYTVIPGHTITSILRHYDRQLIFTEESAFFSTDELLRDESGMYYHSFPVYSLNSEKGHLVDSTQSLLIDNAPVTICRDGLYRWENTAVRDERNAVKISGRVDSIIKAMIAERAYYPIKLHDVSEKRELWIYTKRGRSLIYNYGLDVWYYYAELPCCAIGDVDGKMLMGSDEGGLYEFSPTTLKDFGTDNIDFFCETQYLDFDDEPKLKGLKEAVVCVRPDRKTGFLLTLSADGDEKTSGAVDFSCDAAPSGADAGIVRMKRRCSLNRFSGVRLRIDNKSDGSVCEISSLTLTVRT